MSEAHNPMTPAPDEVRDTLVPSDAPAGGPPDPALGDTLPPEAVAPVWRRDPEVRARPGLALGGGLALLVAACGLLPVLVVTWLLWPRAPVPGASPSMVGATSAAERPSVDFAALRAAIPAPSAPAAAPAPSAPTTPSAEPSSSLHAFARLANRVYDAREVWRKAGQSGKELFRTATLEELGGKAFIDELELSPRRFVWLRREAKVLAPADAAVPDGIAMKDGSNDPGPKVFDGTLGGKPVRAIRSCVFGETYCVVDVVDGPHAAAPAAPPPSATPATVDDGARLAAFDLAVAKEQERLARWAPLPVAAAGATTTTMAAPALALVAGLALALALASLAIARLRGVSATLIGATARLRAAAAGQAQAPGPRAGGAELAALQAAVDEAAAALGDGAARAELSSRRRARLAELARALDAAAAGQGAARVPGASDDDVALAALVASVNAALERLPPRAAAR